MDPTLSSLPSGPGRLGAFVRRALMASAVSAAVAAVVAPAEARGQLVDRGTFLLHAGGEEVGTEEFTILRQGTGDAQLTLATGTLTMHDGRVVKTILRLVGTTMVLNEYEVSVSGSDTLAVRVIRDGNRLRTRSVGPWGEEAWEYPARASTVVLDDGVAHHHFLLGALLEVYGAEARIHAVAPLAQMEALPAQAELGSETIDVGGESVETTRVSLSSGGDRRTAWFDGSGRLVRVALPARGFEAVRLP